MSTQKNPGTVRGPVARSFKSVFTTRICFLLLGLSPAPSIAAAYQQGAGPVGMVSIEVENYDANVSKGGKGWASSYPSGYSGAGALTASANTGTNNNTGYVRKSPRLDYVVNFAKTGVHYVWIRGAGPTGNDDSVHVGLDGAALTSSNRISNFSRKLSWTNTRMGGRVATINVSTTGKHTLNIWMREDGTVLDKIVLTTKNSYTPVAAGPRVSARSTAGNTIYVPVVTLSNSSLNFGSQGVGGISKLSRVRLTNSGTAPLYIAGIIASSGFIQTNNCSGAVSVGGNCVINVQFVPTSTGTVNGSLRISSNAGSSNVVGLTGKGTDGSQSLSSLTPSGPIVINGDRNVVVSGLRITNPNGSCIEIRGDATNIVIQDSEIGPCSEKGINILNSSNISIRNNYIHNTGEGGIVSNKSNTIEVDSNRIEYVESGYEIWSAKKGNISFTNNFVKNVSRRGSSGGNIVLVAYSRGPGIRINNNIGINILGKSRPEDLVNIYKSSGTAYDPIQVNNNKFLGGGPSLSGGGILLSDQGGSYQTAENNILVNPGSYGIAIGGGRSNSLRNNRVFSDAQRSFSNVGLVVWRFNNKGGGTQPGSCYGHTVENNEITWWKGPNYRNNGQATTLSPYFKPKSGADNVAPNCDSVAGWKTNKFDKNKSQPARLGMSIWNPAWNNP